MMPEGFIACSNCGHESHLTIKCTAWMCGCNQSQDAVFWTSDNTEVKPKEQG